jgi:hypothetical protein
LTRGIASLRKAFLDVLRQEPASDDERNADNAVIYLRGQLESDEQIEELVRAAHARIDLRRRPGA